MPHGVEGDEAHGVECGVGARGLGDVQGHPGLADPALADQRDQRRTGRGHRIEHLPHEVLATEEGAQGDRKPGRSSHGGEVIEEVVLHAPTGECGQPGILAPAVVVGPVAQRPTRRHILEEGVAKPRERRTPALRVVARLRRREVEQVMAEEVRIQAQWTPASAEDGTEPPVQVIDHTGELGAPVCPFQVRPEKRRRLVAGHRVVRGRQGEQEDSLAATQAANRLPLDGEREWSEERQPNGRTLHHVDIALLGIAAVP